MSKKVHRKTAAAPAKSVSQRELKALVAQTEALRSLICELEDSSDQRIKSVHRECRASALNLLQALALNDDEGRLSQNEIEPWNDHLDSLGLARLCRRQSHALSTIDALRAALYRLRGKSAPPPSAEAMSRRQGRQLLERRAEAILGPAAHSRTPRIFVSLTPEPKDSTGTTSTDSRRPPAELTTARVAGFCFAPQPGETEEDWRRLRQQIRVGDTHPHPPRLWIQLRGPVIETGMLAQGSAVLRWEPRRNQLGKLINPARLWLTSEDRIEAPLQPVEAVLPVCSKLLRKVQTEDVLSFRDARGRRRQLRVRGAGRSGCLAESDRTTYVEAGAPLHLERQGKPTFTGHVGALPRVSAPLMLFPDNLLVITREPLAGRPAVSEGGFLRSPARISCTAPEILGQVRAGERVLFGDGSIAGVIETADYSELRIRITTAGASGTRLRSGVPMRFPDSTLEVTALGPDDAAAVAFAARHADGVVLTGVERSQDVQALGQELEEQAGHEVAIVLGIETRRGVEALPDLLLEAMQRPQSAIRLSLGALAAEYGTMRLDRVLDQVRWLARSAQVPLIADVPALDRLTRQELLHPAEVHDATPGLAVEGLMIGDGAYANKVAQHLLEGTGSKTADGSSDRERERGQQRP